MKTINVKQGSDEWIAERRKYRAASEAPVVMGCCGYITREELLRMKSTGGEKEFSDYVRERILARGHEIEAAARPLAEEFLGEELYPVTGVCDEGYLLASFDGLTMGEDSVWECKSWNEAKAADVLAGRVPERDYWQVVHQLAVSGAERAWYHLTDGTPDRSEFVELPAADVQDDIARLRASWAQFDADLEAYVPRPVEPEVVGRAPSALPTLHIEVTGAVTASNLDGFREHALAVFSGINTDLNTDEDFADAEKTVKWCGEVEAKLEAAKEHALAQTADIDALFRAVDEIKAEARHKRLELDKLVKARKQSICAEILAEVRDALSAHLESLSADLPGSHRMPPMNPDFAGAMKGKRTVSSLRAAVEQLLADSKVEADAVFRRVARNLSAFEEFSVHAALFRDLDALALKEPEDFLAVVKLRIAEDEERRRRADEERKAHEARAAAEAEARAAAAARAAEEAEAVRELARPAPASAPAPAPQADALRRPDLEDLVEVIASHYSVDRPTALAWLLDGVEARRAA
jgi:putative phage-type endonuclease